MQRFITYFLLFICLITTPCFATQQLIIEPNQGTRPILDAMTHAKSSIDLVMYGLTEKQIIAALIQSHHQGKQVRVLLQRTPYKAENENQWAIEQLQSSATPLIWPDDKFKFTHQKTLILDHHDALIMTFNFTHSTFTKERNFAILINDPDMIQEITRVFQADYQHQAVTVHHPDLIWSPDNSREKFLNLIQQAQSTIKIYAENISDYELVGALAKAARRGVTVNILTSANKNDHAPNKKMRYLSRAGVIIRYSPDLIIHAKVMIIDHNTAVVGSINMTKSSLDNNRELAVISRDRNVIKQLNNTFEQDWQPHFSMSPVYTQAAGRRLFKYLHFIIKNYH